MQQLFKVGHVESLHLDGRAHAKRERERRVWMVLLFFGGRPWSRAERGSCVRRGVEVGPRYTFRFCYFLPPVPSKLFHNCCSCRPRPPPPPPPPPWLSARSWAGGGLRSPLSIGILLVRPRPLSIESIYGINWDSLTRRSARRPSRGVPRVEGRPDAPVRSGPRRDHVR
jgi:hypothetical protein